VHHSHYYQNKKSKSNNKLIPRVFLTILVLVLSFFLVYSIDLLIYRGKIYPNVVAIQQEIGKLNKNQAYQIIKPVAEKILSNPIIINYDDTELLSIIPREHLGASIDVTWLVNEAYAIARQGTFVHRISERIFLIKNDYQLSNFLKFNENKFDSFYKQLQSKVEQSPCAASLTSSRVIPAQIGITINRQELLVELQKSIIDSASFDSPNAIELPVYYQKPTISTAEILAQIGVYEIISTYETSLQGKEENTIYNIKKAAQQINGLILNPQDIFFFNQVVGPAEKEDGYRESIIIANGQFVNGYGGGVCQVSTTLYNAALLANLQIIERYNHSIYGEATNYVPLGRDAAVFYGYKDLKFRNSLDQRIVLFCDIKSNNLVVTIYGEEALDKTIKIISQDMKTYDYDLIKIKREDTITAEDNILQEGIPGYSIKTFRIIIDSKGERMEFLSEDRYTSVAGKILVN
jgi:vancomycin resistance protein VanW